ncbi:MAG: sensor histidine kinase, partial [Solirubrobacteraceae bacterium]
FAEISVLDDGPGIAVEDRERIFERFTRGSASSGGFGLGLAIGRELALRMGGSLELAEQDTGAGARFTLRLPLSDHGGVGA